MKKLIIAIIVPILCSFSFAQFPGVKRVHSAVSPRQQAAAGLAQKSASQSRFHSPTATGACSFTFTSGTNLSFLKYCVTANGNITQLETPEGQEHINVGPDGINGEGYGICDFDANVEYDDYAEFGDTGNWNSPVVISQSAKMLKIARTTADGAWTLTQTISQIAGGSPSVKIVMALKNNAKVTKTALLLRYADVDADGLFANNLDATLGSAFAWNSISFNNPFGLVLQNVGTPQAGLLTGFVQAGPGGPSPCNIQSADGPLVDTDGSVAMGYGLRVPPGASKTVTVAYKGL
ncbi:MAG: hypothetical protein HY010_18340 [Acidobacteria bacterium]|nr:hypothetical protein [Acidobacteriota bacterium]